MRKYLSLLLLCLLPVASGCKVNVAGQEVDLSASYQPIFAPAKLVYDSRGLYIEAEGLLATPIGVFGIGAQLPVVADSDLYLILRDQNANTDIAYPIASNQEIQVFLDGESVVTIDGDRVVIDILPGTTHIIDIRPSSSSSASGNGNLRPNLRLDAFVTARYLNIRSGPGPEYDQMGRYETDQQVELMGRNNNGTWVQMTNGNWLGALYLDIQGDVILLPVTAREIGAWDTLGTPSGVQLRAKNVLRIRGGAGTEYRQLNNPETLTARQVVDVVGRSRDGNWYKVNVSGNSGWVRNDPNYIELIGNTSRIPIVN